MWFGGLRVDAGQMQIGQLTAFLQYLIQILMSVMMSTMMLMIAPRAQVRGAHRGGAGDGFVRRAAPAAGPRRRRPRLRAVRGRDVRLPRRRGPRAVEHPCSRSRRAPRRRSSGRPARQDDADQPDPAAVRRDRGPRAGRRRRRPRPPPRGVVEHHRPGPPEAVPVHRHGGVLNLRYGNPDASDDELWHALEVAQARDFVERTARPTGRPDRQGRHERLGRPAAAALDRAGAARRPDVYVLRRQLRARRRHGRPPRGPPCGPRPRTPPS